QFESKITEALESKHSCRDGRILSRKTDKCCSPLEVLPSRNRTPGTDSRYFASRLLPSFALRSEIIQICWMSMTPTCSPTDGPLGNRDLGARNRLEICPDHLVLVHHAISLRCRIEPQNVTMLPYALLDFRGFRIGKKGVRHPFIFRRAECP